MGVALILLVAGRPELVRIRLVEQGANDRELGAQLLAHAAASATTLVNRRLEALTPRPQSAAGCASHSQHRPRRRGRRRPARCLRRSASLPVARSAAAQSVRREHRPAMLMEDPCQRADRKLRERDGLTKVVEVLQRPSRATCVGSENCGR